jgi:hypothetical protein
MNQNRPNLLYILSYDHGSDLVEMLRFSLDTHQESGQEPARMKWYLRPRDPDLST